MSDFQLKNKRILFFSPRFFGYEMEVKKKLELMGNMVDFFDERPSNTVLSKALLRINNKFLVQAINTYYEEIIRKVRDKQYDYIFFIKGESVTSEILKRIRTIFNKAKMILYLWDSIENIKNIDEKIQYFDDVFTFDLHDAKKFKDLKFRPLFYIDEYKYQNSNNLAYDCCFIGTIHSDRYALIENIKHDLEAKGLSAFFYMFIPAKQLYYYLKIFNSSFRHTKSSDFNFKPLSFQEIKNTILLSKTVLDIQHPKQSGLTMRTIEMLGMRKKLITTNPNIKDYDFFNPNNILLVDRESPKIECSFINGKYEKIDETIYDKYSLEFWIKDVFL
ncbi:hypothetical protein [Dendrosporobacter sp. 1207_IL3150]|uniref:hypothetical protein n=1 Tax=Dendrosporobacter sp. 1207_IL3150 TaxID=3084054 RepID=UPI002FDB1796